jgi:hypothetical protein
LACNLPFFLKEKEPMLKISIVDSRTQRRLVVEGKLVPPWTGELRPACEKAKLDLGDRELVVEVKNVTVINQAGENVLFELMKEGVRFHGCGVFTKHMLRQLTRRMKQKAQGVKP